MMYQQQALPRDAENLARFGEYHVKAIRSVQAID
jgi:hypothetical protein